MKTQIPALSKAVSSSTIALPGRLLVSFALFAAATAQASEKYELRDFLREFAAASDASSMIDASVRKLSNKEDKVRAYLIYANYCCRTDRTEAARTVVARIPRMVRPTDELDELMRFIKTCSTSDAENRMAQIKELRIGGGSASGKGEFQFLPAETLTPAFSDRELCESYLSDRWHSSASAGRIVVSSRNDSSRIARSMDASMNALCRSLTFQPPSDLIKVFCADSKWDVSELMYEIHGIETVAGGPESHQTRFHALYGYSMGSDNTIVLRTDLGLGTTAHELVHILFYHNFPHAPPWLEEGTASLFEEFRIESGSIRGTYRPDHWRIQKLAGSPLMKPQELAQLDWKGFYNEPIAATSAKFFCMYLQEEGLLRPMVDALHDVQVDINDNSPFWEREWKVTQRMAGDSDEYRKWLDGKNLRLR